jgi:hypothetical protein
MWIKLALMDQISAPCKLPVAGRQFYKISLNPFTRYNTFRRNWHPAKTTYRILAPCYKSETDIEDFNKATGASAPRTGT